MLESTGALHWFGKMNRRRFFRTLILGLAGPRLTLTAIFGSERVTSVDLERAWLSYVSSPSDENASGVIELLPLHDVSHRVPQRSIGDHIDRHLGVLEIQVLSGHRLSALLAFRLKTITHGAVSSCLNIIIGQYIHVNPEHFLALLTEHDHLIGYTKLYLNYGLDLVDDLVGQDREAIRRIRALQSVSRADLSQIRDRVIRDLASSMFVASHLEVLPDYGYLASAS